LHLGFVEELNSTRPSMARRARLLAAVSEYAQPRATLNGHTVSQAIDDFLTSVLTVKRVLLHEAIGQITRFRKTKTAAEGRRSRANGQTNS